MRGMNHRAVRWIAERVENRRHVVTTPLSRAVGLYGLVGNPVAKDGELVIKLMVDAGKLFLARGRLLVTSDKRPGGSIGRRWEDSCRQQSGSVRVDCAIWNGVVGE